MRNFLRSGLLFLSLVACAPGGAYDNLTGGQPPAKTATEDAALVAPRPMSPISVSMVSTYRPRFKWELFGEASGAIVELSRTRGFEGDVKRYEAKGREFVVPQDLTPGFWFWRLTSKTEDTVGTKTSPVWEVVVRGPAAHGSSDAPTGSVLDLNGDGMPDFVTVVDTSDQQGGPLFPVLIPYKGDDTNKLVADEQHGQQFTPPQKDQVPVMLAGGTDMDGDGLSEVAVGSYDDMMGGGYVIMIPGDTKTTWSMEWYGFPGMLTTTAGVREAGDADGDGYGDYFVSDSMNVRLSLGSSKGSRAFVDFVDTPPGGPKLPPTTSPFPLAAAFDANGDGFSDVAVGLNDMALWGPAQHVYLKPSGQHISTAKPGPDGTSTPTDDAPQNQEFSPILFYAGGTGGANEIGGPLTIKNTNASMAEPIAFANGDFNGDGITDLAASMAIGRTRRVCFWFGNAKKGLIPGNCVIDDGSDIDFGTSMTAADLEGDGVDELLVSSKTNGGSIIVLKAEHDISVATRITGLGPTQLTTIWPGRPGPARWAALAANAQSIRVYQGTTELQRLDPYPGDQGFGRAMR